MKIKYLVPKLQQQYLNYLRKNSYQKIQKFKLGNHWDWERKEKGTDVCIVCYYEKLLWPEKHCDIVKPLSAILLYVVIHFVDIIQFLISNIIILKRGD